MKTQVNQMDLPRGFLDFPCTSQTQRTHHKDHYALKTPILTSVPFRLPLI